MSDAAITKQSRNFYEQFQFPGRRPVDRDGLIFLRWFSKSVSECRARNDGRAPRILDAGCGTGNTSLSLARQYPDLVVHAIDQSKASLEKAKALAASHMVTNVRHRHWNMMRPLPYRTRFDIIICLGVLHHTADMRLGLRNLHRSLKQDGILYLWIYGRHGRARHALNMRLIDMLLRADTRHADGVECAREFIRHADDGAALRDLAGNTPSALMEESVIDDPVWIANQFLNPHETLIDMVELLSMVRETGFTLEHAVGLNMEAAERLGSPLLIERFRKLSPDDQWIALDLLVKPERYFVLLRNTTNTK